MQREDVSRYLYGLKQDKNSEEYLRAIGKRTERNGGEKGITFDRDGQPICYSRPKHYESLFYTADIKMNKDGPVLRGK